MLFSRRARVMKAVSNGQPAWDVLQLVPPDAYMPVLCRAADSLLPDQALGGMRLFDALTDAGAPQQALPSALRRVGVSEHASSLFHAVSEVCCGHRPRRSCVRCSAERCLCPPSRARASILRGLKLRTTLVEALKPGMVGSRKWFPQPSQDWSFRVSRRGPGSPQCGCTPGKLKLARNVRGETQTACRPLDADNSELVWIIQVYHGSDVVCDESEKRKCAPFCSRVAPRARRVGPVAGR